MPKTRLNEQHPRPDDLIPLSVAETRSGFSYWTLRRRIADGSLPAVRIRSGRGIRVKVSDVDALFVPVTAGGGQSAG